MPTSEMARPLTLLAYLEQREAEAYVKLLLWREAGNEPNFPFALMEWMQLYNAVETLRRKLRGGRSID